jgi:hypothetical protein
LIHTKQALLQLYFVAYCWLFALYSHQSWTCTFICSSSFTFEPFFAFYPETTTSTSFLKPTVMEAGMLCKGETHSTATDLCLFKLKLVTKLMSTVTRELLAKQNRQNEQFKTSLYLFFCFFLSLKAVYEVLYVTKCQMKG